MFKRWIIVLAAVLLLEVVYLLHLFRLIESRYSVADECTAYLDTVPAGWQMAGDTYYQSKCDWDNPFSAASLEHGAAQTIDTALNGTLAALLATLTVLFLSFLARWIISGRIR